VLQWVCRLTSQPIYLAVHEHKYSFVCCSVLHYVAGCCRVLQCVRCVAACCSVLRCVAVCCSVLQCAPALRPHPTYQVAGTNIPPCVLQCVAVRCVALQCVAMCACTHASSIYQLAHEPEYSLVRALTERAAVVAPHFNTQNIANALWGTCLLAQTYPGTTGELIDVLVHMFI